MIVCVCECMLSNKSPQSQMDEAISVEPRSQAHMQSLCVCVEYAPIYARATRWYGESYLGRLVITLNMTPLHERILNRSNRCAASCTLSVSDIMHTSLKHACARQCRCGVDESDRNIVESCSSSISVEWSGVCRWICIGVPAAAAIAYSLRRIMHDCTFGDLVLRTPILSFSTTDCM